MSVAHGTCAGNAVIADWPLSHRLAQMALVEVSFGEPGVPTQWTQGARGQVYPWADRVLQAEGPSPPASTSAPRWSASRRHSETRASLCLLADVGQATMVRK